MRTSILGLAVALGASACSGSSPSPSTSSTSNNGSSQGPGTAAPAESPGGGSGSSSGTSSGGDFSGGGDSTGSTAGGGESLGPGASTPAIGSSGGGASASGGGTNGLTPPTGGEDASPPATQGMAGVLTSGIWDDGLNYPFFTQYRMLHHGIAGGPGFTTADYDAAQASHAQRSARSVIDAALVIDTTGSMGDEIAYLKAEFANITSAIGAKFPNASQRWALITYRDTPDHDPGDAYVFQTFDFTSDPQAFSTTIDAQSAANGGDYPESPEIGLAQLETLSWRSDPSVAKVAFWVADAPQHSDRGSNMNQAIAGVRDAGIHVYPVSASGTDDLLEFTMRTTALMTGGRYLFLTDDSGVGDPHKVPEIPCFYVTLLEKALVRVASMEISGSYIAPDVSEIIRVSGDPAPDGTCSDFDGGVVKIF